MVKAEWNLSPIGSGQRSNWPAVVVIDGLPENSRTCHPRKRRIRVKELEAIYDSEGPALHSKFQQQTSKVGRLFNAKQVKCENYDNKESKVSDGPSVEGMPLMDIQARVKGKRHRSSSVTFPEADLKNGKFDIKIKLEEVEEEDADLEEPLISLVSKLSKKKRRKLAQAGQSIHEGSTTGSTSAESAVGPPELTNSAETTEDKYGTAKKNFCMEISDSSISPDPNVKSEKVNPFPMDGLISNDAITPVPNLVEKYNFLHCSFSEPLQKANEVRFGSSESKCGTDTVLHSGLDGHMEGSLVCANTVSSVVNGNLIAESGHSGNPSADELESVGCCERQNTKSIHNVASYLHVDEIPIEGTDLFKLTSTPECGEDSIGEMVKMYNSATSSHQASSLPVSPPCLINLSCATGFVPLSPVMELDSDVSNKKSNSAAEFYYDGKPLSNIVDSESQKQRSNCYLTNDEAFDHIVVYNEKTDSGVASNSIMEVARLTDLVQKAAADVMIDSLPVEGSSSKTEKLSSPKPLLNGYTCNGMCCSNEILKSVDSEESAKALHVDCEISPCSVIAVNGLLHSSNHFCNGSAADETLIAAADNPISYSADTARHSPIKGRVAGLKTYIPPRKILSNRKTFSPDSQEKLRHALNNDFDALKNSELMTKKPTAKGVLKLSDASCASSGNNQTKETIEFSLRQMQDFKTISSKFLRGLKSLKNIVEETRCTETGAVVPSKFTAEEIRMATEEASQIETTTKKWLSIMTKDCNRFCKILRTTEKKSAAANGTCKGTKKVSFADVAGGTLCEIRVYDGQSFDEQPPVAVSESVQVSL